MAKAVKKKLDGKRERQPVVTYWLNEIGAAQKREKEWRKEGERILKIYGGEKKDIVPFNILYSNTETLEPALYSNTPRPVVQRRFKDEDPLGKASALAGQRGLEFLLDTNVEGYETFDDGMNSTVLDALLPGRGVTCIKYDYNEGELALTQSVDDGDHDDSAEQRATVSPPPSSLGTEAAASAEPTPYKTSELVCIDTRSWNRVFFGYAKKWSKVPWIAYEEHIDKTESTRLFGAELANKIVYTENDDRDIQNNDSEKEEKNRGDRKTACIYQIWDKDTKKIRYISAQFQDGYLKVEDDPLGLTGFFNCPKPLQFLRKSNDLMPVALYALYENQAKELNRLTVRINRIVDAIKARGIYDSSLGGDIADLMKADDNQLVPSDQTASLAAEKGLGNAIWFMPVEQLVNVLTQLYIARENCKKVIYEITGIADIMRGVSNASETLGAQEIKQSWGTLRLKRLQKEVQRYARDLLRMMLEVAAAKFSEDTWSNMTGLPFLTTSQREQVDQVAAAVQMQAQQMAAAGQKPNPQQMQQFQQLQAELAKPVWGKVLEMLRDDTQRAYRIDIETNSTVEAEATEDQKNIAEVMTALGQFLNGVTPLVVKGALPFNAAKAMMLSIVRRFRFGPEIEDEIKMMQAPAPEGQAEAAAKQEETKQKQMEGQQRIEEGKIKMAVEQQKAQVAQVQAQAEIARIQLEAGIEVERLNREAEFAREEHAMKMEELRSKHAVGMEAGRMKLEQMKQQAKVKQKVPA